MKKHLTIACIILTGMFFTRLQAQPVKQVRYNIIPYPAILKPAKGYFNINSHTAVVARPGAEIFNNELVFLQNVIGNYFDGESSPLKKATGGNNIIVQYDASIGAEAYKLSISTRSIVISAKEPAGVFYAAETLRQLIPTDRRNDGSSSIPVPAAEIADRPAFKWRGMMLDVARSFLSMDYLKKMVDMMAMYKLNKLHLHLTDDQGWRIEIKKYPDLALKSGWREFIDIDSNGMKAFAQTGNTDFKIDPQHLKQVNGKTLYGGFYTQEEMKGFINYAAERHVEIIPEIDMPGHMMAAEMIYPHLTCDTVVKFTNGFSNPICPCNPAVLAFAKDIFTEIAALFPSRYIHIGGDEVEKSHWETSPVSQAFMKTKGFHSTAQLQSYFNNYILDFFRTKGKILIGWDEIVDGGIDSSATVMYWRPWAPDAPRRAAANGNKLIMSPDGPLYFDAPPEGNALFSVYHYNPLDTIYNLNKDEQSRVMGVQANLWSELLPSEKRADYLLMPRMTALAELGWTYRPLYNTYLQRLNIHYLRWNALKINYKIPDPENIVENHVFVKHTSFFQPARPHFIIRYTTDGSQPTVKSRAMHKAIKISHTLDLKLATFTLAGRQGDVYTLHFKRVSYKEAIEKTIAEAGLRGSLFRGKFKLTTSIKQEPDSVFNIRAFEISAPLKGPSYAIKFNGFIKVPETAIYTFALTCDDGGVLYIGEDEVINNDGMHSESEKAGQAALKKGMHPIRLNYIQGDGNSHLELKYSTGTGPLKPIPVSWLSN
ncbi:family 20 glycosylhydrolase [Mucilaginibacter sabulilitoris]|uniref:beta-N-acetylhexosaminidase n=1 Tax=Mucilaginibacter sabulilitoris TaxID=1173583 RepID=A0ABZ0TKY7_9SPHI|nr:family 20 glycosylhydrolase [Mucilaginibacter sabulilitoris]WPU92838.1 family 20 glycosylhydrolase [Mucilaginibacter sabulilitoris]